ncbi:sigma-54-dependent transcriptional regulator [Sandaracinus amylolyticus]|uniref:sigma-54-dependent transcriptional regulator n=1 Tax=Sandaracinus amylolyticus TaxID=927083 RepID=UPI001F1F7899|nr:sigma-54 dependent transcriptional regulator [Sandaracinus amylolyticus]
MAPRSVPRGRVLVVDDETHARDALAEILAEEGYETATAADGLEALRLMEELRPEVVLTDLKMPNLDGLGLLDRGKAEYPETSFVVMTAFGTIDTAVEAIRRGAENYVTKPLDVGTVTALLARAMDKAKLAREASELRERLHETYDFSRILGEHPAMRRLTQVIAQVAPSRATVLIHGESGTGKELIAAAIHENSKRKSGPFVRLNCAALAESLLESELFGHEKGAFTGAMARRKGRFEQADGGTLFLDEISEVPKPLQVKLLRFLQERELERVGGNETIRVDVRVVAATNRDLKQCVQDGTFREDLYYRLDVVRVDVPPLRARRSDIPILAHHFLHRFAKENERELEGFSDEAMKALLAHAWPGNVRELENAVERAVVLAPGKRIEREHLPMPTPAAEAGSVGAFVPGMTLAEIERVAILQTLEACEGSTGKAAEMLGISRRKIQYRLKEWGMGGEIDGEPD